MKTLTQKEIDIIIENHKHWIAEDCDGWENMRADFRCADLTHADLKYADLRDANLRSANLRYADLRGADLRCADLEGADLRGADLRCADLRGADLRYADLRGADLRGADLRRTNFEGTNLEGANFCGAINIPFIPMTCPEKGSFIGYKKAHARVNDEYIDFETTNDEYIDFETTTVIIELEICEEARRSSATRRKCRCDKAKVISISNLDGDKTFDIAYSDYDDSFIYRVGEIVEEPNFCEDRFDECAEGIHFFISRQEAVNY